MNPKAYFLFLSLVITSIIAAGQSPTPPSPPPIPCTSGLVPCCVDNTCVDCDCQECLDHGGFAGQKITTQNSTTLCGPGSCLPVANCGCSYTQGYWQSPRFGLEDGNSGGNYDTCSWPTGSYWDGDDTVPLCNISVACPLSGINFTLGYLASNANPPQGYPYSKTTWKTWRQYLSFKLNLANGLCECDPVENSEQDIICIYYMAIEEAFGDNATICSDPYDFAGTPQQVVPGLCARIPVDEITQEPLYQCNWQNVLMLANEGKYYEYLGHCEDEYNPRGCCVRCGSVELNTTSSNTDLPDVIEIINLVIVVVVFVVFCCFFLIIISWRNRDRDEDNEYAPVSRSFS